MYYKLPRNTFLKIKPNEMMMSAVIDSNRINVVINEEAFDIYKCCNGENSLEMIIRKMKEKYVNPDDYVKDFINENLKNRIVEQSEKKNKSIIVKGSNSVYYPETIVWEITNVCPLKCKHCYLGEKKNTYINRSEIDQIIMLIKERGITTVQLTGGEVFSHPDIEYIVERLNELDIRISISTSGYIYNESTKIVLDSLRKNASIRISIDGTESYHNSIRGKDDAYARAIYFIKEAKRKGLIVQIGSVIIDQSDEMIYEMIDTVKSMGVSLHSFSIVLDEGEAIKNKKCSRYSNQMLQKKLEEWSIKYSTNEYKIQTSKKDTDTNCGCGYKLIRIRPDLTLTPCPMIEGVLGNLKKESFDEIMKRGTELYMDLELPTRNKKYCEYCEKEDNCGECVALALVNNKKLKDECRWAKENGVIE